MSTQILHELIMLNSNLLILYHVCMLCALGDLVPIWFSIFGQKVTIHFQSGVLGKTRRLIKTCNRVLRPIKCEKSHFCNPTQEIWYKNAKIKVGFFERSWFGSWKMLECEHVRVNEIREKEKQKEDNGRC